MTKITWSIAKRKLKDLIPADYNPRKLTEADRMDLEASVKEFGLIPGIIINIGTRKDIIIGGHQRVEIMADLGRLDEEIDIIIPSRELTLDEEKKLNLRLNKNQGQWDYDKLKQMDIELLLEVGFGDEDLQEFFDDVDVIDDDQETKKETDTTKARIKPGEIYQLGRHKIMCGDPRKMEDVKKLMGDDLADMVYCDPGNKKIKDLQVFAIETVGNMLAVGKPNFHVFYWCQQEKIHVIQKTLEEGEIETKAVCLWIKNSFKPSPTEAFNKVHEPCIYGVKGTPHLNKGMSNINEIINKEVGSGNQVKEEIMEHINIWLARNVENEEVSGKKPISIIEKPMKRCTAPGHIVLDLFGGSGSTILAAEQLGRNCRMIEKDPVLCTEAIDRWEKFTNQKAKLI